GDRRLHRRKRRVADGPSDPSGGAPRALRRYPALHCLADAPASLSMTRDVVDAGAAPSGTRLEQSIVRVLTSGSYAAIALLAVGGILAGAELFTNGIEWFGRKLQLAEGAVGSVLAAVGTALPETMIPIIAILSGSGSAASHGIGVGATLGAPFMLATLAMF